jgi:hypothetical protein
MSISLGLMVASELNADLAKYHRRLRDECVQIILDLEQHDEIEGAGAVEIIALRSRPTNARGPPVGIVKYKQCHPRRPGTMQSPRLFGNHILEP